jgi:hypothetical protein
MSKNLTRKGLALGAVVALGSSLFAGTPATAAPSALFLESAFGTSLEGVLGQNFVLSSTAAGAADGDDVSYYIEGVTAANLTVVGRYTTALSTTTTGNVYSSAADANGEAIKLVTTDKGLISLADTDAAAKVATVKVDTWQSGAALQFALKVNATNVTATTAVKVTPFLDNVLADGIPGANELKGTAVTVNFNKASELTATPTLQAIALGSNVKANVAVTKVNLEQFRAATEGAPAAQDFVNVDFTSNGSAFQSDKAPVWNTTDKLFVVDSTGTPTAGNVYGATAQFGSTDSASAALVTATAGEVSALGAFAVTKGTSYRASVTSSDHVVRAGSGAVSIATTATVVTGKAKAGQKVTFKIAESGNSTLDAAATVTAGGKTLANAKSGTTEDVSVEVATDADGKATLAIAYAGIKDGNQFVVSATAAGASGSVAVSTNRTFTGKDSVATAIIDNSAAISGGTSVRQVAKGSALSIDYTLVDQFGQAPSGDFQLVISENSSSANFTANVPVSAGKATFSGSDNSTADNDYTVTATVQKKNATSGNWEAIGSGLSRTAAIQIAAVGTPSSITVTAGATTGVTRDAVTYVAGNTDLEQDTVTRTAPSNGTTLTGTVVGASGAVVDGATVTFTGANLLFKAGNVYGVGSITVRTDASGAYDTINVYSNKAGKQTVTITSGGATKTVDITFAAVTTGGKTWTSNAPVRVLPGTTLKVTGTLTDTYGNAVDVASGITVAYTGPGFLTATPATQTDENGAVSATVLLGAADAGTASFKFTYDNGTSSDDTDDVVFTSSVAIGAAPATAATAAVSGSKGKFFVSATNAAAKKVVVKVAGKFFGSFTGTAAKKSVALKAPKGSHKVTVFVGGKLVATKTITVK